ncbi:hypothetical protein BT63DRAFT_474013 [Microthyrium microscopicum]|uniref:Transcription initiation factor IIF subunit beta n=1 Tax=Microthyrium microscopicum TaxID=703497 RepID=A0A6A6UTI4_9PEZI|nr:hypothetical protein BT63DRAFT_474013 [Microthyrium microscopicum]
MSQNGVKHEEDIKVKTETEFDDEFVDDDDDTGELAFPKPTEADLKYWLVRVPRDLWSGLEGLEKYTMDEPIPLGELWVWPQGNKKDKMRLNIDHKTPGFSMIPKEYDMEMLETSGGPSGPKNTFIFSEKQSGDRPGRPHKAPVKGEDALHKTEGGRIEKPQPRARTIPKHTAFVAKPNAEVICNPCENDEYRRIEDEKARIIKAQQQDLQVEDIKEDDRFNANVSVAFGKAQKTKAPEFKSQRIEEAQLLDMLSRKFAQFKYWPLKALKEETRQPEAYLREVLSKIAVLVKTGQAANTWTLKSSAALAVNYNDEDLDQLEEDSKNAIQADIAPDALSDDEDDDDDMEDVV